MLPTESFPEDPYFRDVDESFLSIVLENETKIETKARSCLRQDKVSSHSDVSQELSTNNYLITDCLSRCKGCWF